VALDIVEPAGAPAPKKAAELMTEEHDAPQHRHMWRTEYVAHETAGKRNRAERERRGGRQRGVPNKKTALNNAALTAAASNPTVSPLEFLLAVMRDPNVSLDFCIKGAQVAAPFVHPKPGGLPPRRTARDRALIPTREPAE